MRALKIAILLALLASNLGCGGHSAPSESAVSSVSPKTSDLKARLQGTYRVITARFRDDDKLDLSNLTITFDGDRMIANDLRDLGPKTERFHIDESQSPARFDAWPDGGDPAKGANLGLIRVDGDFVELCMSPGRPVQLKLAPGKDDKSALAEARAAHSHRPAALSAEYGMYIVMKRVRN